MENQIKNKRVYFRGPYVRVRNGKEQHIKECFVGGRDEYNKKFTKSPKDYYNEMNDENIRFTTLYHYSGGKGKFYSEVQFIYNEFYSNNNYSICLVPFLGGGSDFLNITPKIDGKVKKMVVNDINKTIGGVFINVRDNREILKERVIELLEIKPDNEEELKVYFKLLEDECRKIELNKDYENIELSSMFLILQNNSKNGIYEWNIENEYSNFCITTMKKNNDNNIPKKIDYFGWYMDRYENFIIENMSYDELIYKYGSEETLIIGDPLYVKEKLVRDDNNGITKTSVDYGNKGFDHQKCLDVFSKEINGSSLIYHNYFNVDLVDEFERCGFTSMEYRKKNISNNSDGTKKDCVEVIIYLNKRNKKSIRKENKILNNINYIPVMEMVS